MIQNSEQQVQGSAKVEPRVGSCYRNGWHQMWKYFLELLLITVIMFALFIPSSGLSVAEEMVGVGAYFVSIFALVYSVLILWPIQYGVSFALLKAARGDRLAVKDMFAVFQNYGNAILANLLVGVIIILGFALLIVPGIIFACKLAFVPYLIVERKMEAIEAVKESWRMTRGHAGRIFLLGLLAIPIFIAGFICCIVGVILSVIWVELAFASMYHAVSRGEARSQLETASPH